MSMTMGLNASIPAVQQPVIFQRAGSSKILGIIVYLLAGVVIGGIVALMAALFVAIALQSVPGISKELSMKLGFAVAGFGLLWLFWWMIKDFLRHCRAEVKISTDGIEAYLIGRKQNIPIDQIHGIHMIRGGTKVVIDLKSGKELHVPTDLVRPETLLQHLQRLIAPTLAGRIQSALDGGAAVDIQDQGGRAYLIIWLNLFRFLLGVALLLKITHLRAGLKVLEIAMTDVLQCLRAANGGFTIDSNGFTAKRSQQQLKWEELESAVFDRAGMQLRFSGNREIAASPYAQHYVDLWTFLALKGIKFEEQQ